MERRSILMSLAASLLAALALAPARAQTYTVLDLGPISPRGINKHAQIACQALGPRVNFPDQTESRAARWDAQTGLTFLPETFTLNVNGYHSDFSIQFPVSTGSAGSESSLFSDAVGINNLGEIVGLGRVNVTGTWLGNQTRTFLIPHAYHWNTAAIPAAGNDLGVLAPGGTRQVGSFGSGGPFISLAAAINDSGEIAGTSNAWDSDPITGAVDSSDHACLWSGGVLQDIDPHSVIFPDFHWSYAAALNNPMKDQNGNIVRPTQVVGIRNDGNGEYAFMYSNGSLIDLSPLGGVYSEARAINDQSQVAGSIAISWDSWQSFRWEDVNGDNAADPSEMTVMATPAGFIGSFALGMNNAGQVVGAIYNSPDGFQQDRAFFWDPATASVVDLNDRIDPALGIVLQDAIGINDNGEIICQSYYYETGESHAYLLKPVAKTTPRGQTVTVTPPLPGGAAPTDQATSLTFTSVTSPGETSVLPGGSNSNVPPRYQIPGTSSVPVAFDITTTATFTGKVAISVPYDPAVFPWDPVTNPTGAKPSLLHYEGGQWRNITVSVNVQNHLVCGETLSFSPFAVALDQTEQNPDTTAPVISTPGDQAVSATSASGAAVTFTATALDDMDGPVAVTCSPASGALFPLGESTVTCSAADAAGNQANTSFKVSVTCAWSGVLQPINSDGSSVFKLGSTVPVKFTLTGASAGITDLVARLSYAQVSGNDPGAINEADSTSAATTGNLFRYTGGQYLLNWSTKGLSKGKYRLYVDLGDGVSHTVEVGLR